MLEAHTVFFSRKFLEHAKNNSKRKLVTPLVEELSWAYVMICVGLVSGLGGLNILSAITLEKRYILMDGIITPIAATSFVLNIFTKPKRTDRKYMNFIWGLFWFAILSCEGGTTIAMFRKGRVLLGIFSLCRAGMEYYAFRKIMYLRKEVAKLSPVELSKFLCEAILVKGTAAMGPVRRSETKRRAVFFHRCAILTRAASLALDDLLLFRGRRVFHKPRLLR